MRNFIILASTTMLAACGGDTGPQSPGNIAPPAGVGTTPTGGTFVNPTEAKTYAGIGGVQHFQYTTRSDRDVQADQLYAGDATTARNSGISITYNPRDAIFDITIEQPKGSVSSGAMRYQDPAHRTDFGGLNEPQTGVPNLPTAAKIQYLQYGSKVGDFVKGSNDPAKPSYDVGTPGASSNTGTFFYQQPGTTTRYVTYAGYVRNTLGVTTLTDPVSQKSYTQNSYSLDRGVFAYGERSNNNVVPRTGTGTFGGDMIATMVFNPGIDTDRAASTYFQWITGSQSTTIDFAALTVKTDFSGTVGAPALDAYTNGKVSLPSGSVFSASAMSKIDLVGAGGFLGTVGSASFTAPDKTISKVNIAGSSVDGAFFGPNAEEIGGGFRIVGGTPDQRIDILGAFTGKK